MEEVLVTMVVVVLSEKCAGVGSDSRDVQC